MTVQGEPSTTINRLRLSMMWPSKPNVSNGRKPPFEALTLARHRTLLAH